jgi:hypothetical protein
VVVDPQANDSNRQKTGMIVITMKGPIGGLVVIVVDQIVIVVAVFGIINGEIVINDEINDIVEVSRSIKACQLIAI